MDVDLDSFSILGYPKTGNTWIHQVIVKALDIGWFAIHHTHAMPTFNNDPYDRAVYNFSSHFSRKKLIVLTRNAGDTIVSLYMHNVFREAKPLFNGTVDDMLFDPIYGIDKFIRFHVILFEEMEKHKDTVESKIFKYEDIKNNQLSFVDMFHFIGFENDIAIKFAIQYSSFEAMKDREMNNETGNVSTLARSPHWKKTNNSFKAREGKVGNYVNHFSEKSLLYIEKRINELPEAFR